MHRSDWNLGRAASKPGVRVRRAIRTLSGSVILASFLDTVGLVRSTDAGAHWTRVSGSGTGLPAGAVDDLTEDIQNSSRLYLTSSGVGVFRSDDLGSHWLNISRNDLGDTGLNNNILNFSTAAKVRVAQDGRAFVGIVGTPNHDGSAFVSYVGFSSDGGAHWTAMDAPFLEARGKPFFHFSLSVDRSNSIVRRSYARARAVQSLGC